MSAELLAMLLQNEIKITSDMDAEAILKEVFSKAKNHWMVVDPNHQIKGAFAVALTKLKPEDRARLMASIDAARAINAAASGVPVDFGAMLAKHEGIEPLPYDHLWLAA